MTTEISDRDGLTLVELQTGVRLFVIVEFTSTVLLGVPMADGTLSPVCFAAIDKIKIVDGRKPSLQGIDSKSMDVN